MTNTKVSVLAPDLSGGGGTRVYFIAKILQKLGYDVTVFGFLFGEEIYPQPPENLPVSYVKGCDFPQMIGNSINLLKAIDGDIIYAIKPRLTSFGIGIIKTSVSKKPLLLDIDDWEMSWFGGDDWQYKPTIKQLARDLLNKDGSLRNPQYPLYLQWSEKLISQANAITVNNRFLEYRYGGTYLPNGKDTDLFNPELFNPDECRAQYGLSDYRVLMFPGTARPHKGLEDVLIALDELNQPDLKLVLVGGREIGDGYVEDLLAKWGKWIIKLPSQPLDAMPEVVASAHIVVVPQREKDTAIAQFPIKLTDGMAMAKPIISTKVGDIPEILGDTGWLVDAESPGQIATAITDIFNDYPSALNQGNLARQRCIENYSLDKMASILSKIMEILPV